MVDQRGGGHPQSRRQRALSMVALMVLMSMGPLLTVPAVSAHAEPSGVTWPLEGSNDTGWVQLDAYGALPEFGQQATADWNLSFAPGAELSNITLEVRASGQNGMTIAEPHLVVDGMGTSLFDWRGLGVLGEVDAFSSGATYSGRLTPNSNSNAGWVLPSDAEITEMMIEVLAPADPLVSLQKLDFDLKASAVNPATGLLYVAVNDKLLVLHATNNPNTIDAYDFEAENGVLDLVVDSANARLHMLMGDGTFRALSLVDSSAQTPLGSGDVDQFLLTTAGDVFAANGLGMYKWDGQAWTGVVSAASPDAEVEALAMIEVNNVVYASLDGKGVLRYDTATNQALSTWTSANTLHSDRVAHMTLSGNQLLLGSLDNGVGRFDHSAGFWLSTWSSANWLDSNDIGGIERVDSMLFILNGDSLHSYNTSNGVFSTTYSLSDFDLTYDGVALIQWPSAGAASPALNGLLVDDGSGTLAHLSPGQSTLYEGGLRLASGPSSEEMTVAIEENGVLYIGTADGSGILRYDSNEALWLAPWTLSGRDILEIKAIGSSFFVALDNPASVVELDATGAVSTTFSATNCYPSSASISSMAVDSTSLVLTLDSGTFASIELSSGTCTTYDTTNGLPTSFVGDVALWGDTAYVATENKGVLRYDLNNDTWLEPWGSTGINGVNNAPVAVVGDVVHLGLQGYGVARKNMASGEILSPLLAGQGGVLPSNQIYALETDGSNLYIGTQQGARKWDGTQATSFGQGSSWQTRPQQFFDFAVEASTSGGNLYAGTNIGVCKYNIATMGINDCQNVYDGMPNWASYSVGYDNTYVYGGTTNGVGAITKSNFQHDFNWGEGTQTGNAVVEIMGDIAYIGTDGLGVLRYNITSNQWLTPFTEDNGVLDGGNDDITGMVADIRPNLLWIGGDDGFQLINVTTGGEAYDIERNSNLYNANGPPRDMMIQNNIMYYHAGTQSDSVSRLDVANLTAFNNLDIGAQVGENGGDIVSMELVGDLLMVSVVSGQWWNSDGSGGIAQWNTTTSTFEANILPTGSIDRVTSYESSNGNTWVSWGELKLELYDTNQNLVGTWTNFEFPIRGIVEHNGETLFATEDGIARYSETTNQWNTTWESGNGLPSNAGDIFYDLWTDGTNLVVGGARFSNFGQFQEGIVSHRNSGGSWTAYPADSTSNMPDGYPIAMEMCGGLLNVAMYNNNGGIARFDLQNATVESDFDRSDLDGTGPASVACDSQDTLYIGYYNDNQPISRYSYASTSFLSSLTTASHNLPSDRVWYDGLAHSGSQLIIGHAVGNSGSNLIAGGYSTIVSNGATALQAQVRGAGSPVTSLQWLTGTSSWLIGQAGGSSGYSHVSTLNSNGIQKVVDLPGLVSGQVTSMVANATHIWVATGSSAAGNFGSSGSGLLQGTFLPNGTVEWQFGWTLPGNTVASDFHLHGTDLFIASSPGGMLKLDTTTKTITSVGGSLHGKFDTMHVFNNQLVIGLAGEGGSPPGVQMFNPLNGQFGNGRLIAGLPSNVVNSFTTTNAILYIGTNGGVGRWNYSTNDWMDPLTSANGLPVDIVEDVVAVGSDIYMATPAGLFIWDSTAQTGTTMSVRDGLMGQSTWGLTTFGISAGGGSPMLAISHDGRGSERPGVTLLSTSTQQVDSTHRFDQLPSNTISALASDWWGVHMATDVGPLTHWNASSGDFEDGTSFFQGQYPIVHMESDGEDVLSIGSQNAVMVSDARTEGHPYSAYITALGARQGTIGANQFWALTDEGLQGWEKNGQLTPVESSSMRRALPLNVRAMDNTGLNITDMTHPGMTVALADPASPHALDPTLGSPGVHGLMFQDVPVILTSPSSGAAIWTKSLSVKYDVLLDISEDPDLALNLQDAVDNGQLFDNTRHVSLRLYSPANGSMEVRLTYDYVRSDTPVIMENLVDRPDDGGGVLTASWSLVHDEDFARYLVFISEGPWSTQPTELMLLGQTPDKAISLHSRLQSEIETANGQPLVDGTAYYGVVVVEYSDGRWGEISEPFGPATPSDEIPQAPAWASATAMGSSGEDGDVELEWARCTALDLAMTNIYVATTPMTDALGRVPYTSVMPNEGNQSMLSLSPGVPVWIGFTCVDEAGQENLSDVTVVGPIVPTGEINDNEAPNPIEGTQADDVPDDEGGRIIVSWNQSLAEDCAFYTVFMQQGGLENPEGETGNVDGFSQASIINNCDETQDIISSLDGVPLIDGQAYTIGVVAYDAWLNGNTDEVLLVSATPFQNIVGSGSTPPRITTLLAFDHAEDDGTAIDVVWEPSTVEDFASYTVWVANAPVSDLSLAYAAFGNNPDVCGCFTFNKQWIDERTNPIELTLSSALYAPQNGALDDGVPALIQPGIELYVAVTVHDLKGNVHLTNLTQATVTPIDNLNDNTAPDRLTELTLSDRPSDDGSALLFEFELSVADDIASYEVYAASFNFNGDIRTQNQGVSTDLIPVEVLGRNPDLPLTIDIVAGDIPVIPGQEVWVAVVARDSSGNAHEDMLKMVSAASEDNGITDPGIYLPDIQEVQAEWFEENSIFVEWDHSTDAKVRGYHIYVNDEMFTTTDDATMVGQTVSANSFLITTDLYEDLDNGSAWYVAVVPYDDNVAKTTVESVKLGALDDDGTTPSADDESSQLSLEALLTGPNLIAAGMVLIIMLLLVIVVRSRGSAKKRNKNWELQEATWGIQDGGWDAPAGSPAPPSNIPAPSPPPGISTQQANDIYAAANQIQTDSYGRNAYQAQQPVLQPQVDPSLLDGLLDEPASAPKSPQIDTSFLDDLL